MFIELDMHCSLDPGPSVGGDEFGMVALSHIGERLHLALDIDNHRFNSTCDDGEFLLEEIPCAGDSMAHQNFIGRKAHAGKVNPLCSFRFSKAQNFWILRGHYKHLRKKRLMPVSDHIDMVS